MNVSIKYVKDECNEVCKNYNGYILRWKTVHKLWKYPIFYISN